MLSTEEKIPELDDSGDQPQAATAVALDDDGGHEDNNKYDSLKKGLSAWWHGNKLEPALELEDSPSSISQDIEKEPLPDANVWTDERFTIVSQIWGEGFMEPGGASLARKLLQPIKIDSKQTVLDLSLKLGGSAALLCKDNSLYMEALETQAELAEKAGRYINSLGLGKRIPIRQVDYDNLELAEHKYDLIYSRERLFAIEHKKDLIKKIGDALKSSGQFLFTDYMLDDPDAHKSDIAAWSDAERHSVFPWTMDAYKEAFEELGFKIWAVHDFTEEFLSQIHKGWLDIARALELGKVDFELTDLLMQEGSIWLARARAIENGALKVQRMQFLPPHAEE